jgi:hypothetical protein
MTTFGSKLGDPNTANPLNYKGFTIDFFTRK